MASRAAQVMSDDGDGDIVAPPPGSQATSPYANSVAELTPPDGDEGQGDEFVGVDEGGDATLAGDQGNQPLIQPQGQGHGQQQQPGRHERYSSRSQRNASQRAARDRDRSTIARLQAENQELRSWRDQTDARLSEFDQGRHQERIDRLDRDIGNADASYKDAIRRLTIATRAMGQGEDGADEAFQQALNDRDNAVMLKSRLTVELNMAKTGSPVGDTDGRMRGPQGQGYEAPQQQQRDGRQAPPPMRPDVQSRVNLFMEDNPWWDPRSGDLDSQIVLQIDRQVAADGFLPNTDDYWDEVRERASKYLPHRFADDGGGYEDTMQQPQPRQAQQRNGNVQQLRPGQQQQQPIRRGPPTGGAADGGGNRGNAKGVLLTSGRKEHMIEMGVLDRDGRTVLDKTKYQRLLKQYDAYDRENGEAAR